MQYTGYQDDQDLKGAKRFGSRLNLPIRLRHVIHFSCCSFLSEAPGYSSHAAPEMSRPRLARRPPSSNSLDISCLSASMILFTGPLWHVMSKVVEGATAELNPRSQESDPPGVSIEVQRRKGPGTTTMQQIYDTIPVIRPPLSFALSTKSPMLQGNAVSSRMTAARGEYRGGPDKQDTDEGKTRTEPKKPARIQLVSGIAGYEDENK
ncbi:uncharacterized protein BT62DRAFT_1081015 [Guyanagaster necrorhizus]|uniref:Uncharacterized protein n=1 Tax=Guyanagaster necrorhizus TaxID=856835 RepID=A0A9P7VHS0_9AGAR|nr:uncharacterized protein BT62DRAFT_1081015 [Guyanagaster necrorhizus MCA 3950]KAG7440276.1 hypothetical protein BT62DRAFT_1081015 [Guyanagaster necrorhizus MCA 3950]